MRGGVNLWDPLDAADICSLPRAPLPLSQGDTPEEGCPFPARNSPILVYFAGGSQKVAKALVVASSCLIQSLVAGERARPPLPSGFQLMVMPLRRTREGSGPQAAPLLCRAVSPRSQGKRAAHNLLLPAGQNFL